MSGVTEFGFQGKTALDVKADLEADWREEFGANVDLAPDSPDGQIIGIMTSPLAALWEGLQAVYSAQDPDKAIGQAQDAVCAITGTQRDAASKSTVTLTVTGDDNTVLDAGREVSVDGTEARFVTLAEAEIAVLTAWVTSTAYVAGDRRTNVGNAYLCISAGTSNTGPETTDASISDGGVLWRYLGEGEGAADVEAEAAETGTTVALSGTIVTIETPVSGWLGVLNIEDADVGSAVETDDHLRVKRESELAAQGSATVAAITAAVLRVDDVSSALTFKNDTATTDVDGRPPHSVEVVVLGGDDQEIAEAIYASVAGGIQPYGTESANVTDTQGLTWAVGFSRPDTVDIWVRVDVIKDPRVFPVDGEEQLKLAITEDQSVYPIGKDVVSRRIVARCFTVTGVLDVTIAYVGIVNPPVAATTIALGAREIADFSTGRVTVNLTDGVP